MELLAVNQPWNLIIFMAIPIVLAETLAITELYLLFTRKFDGAVYYLNRFSGIAVGIYFVGIIYYIVMNAIIPITQAGEWRTVIDVIAVSTYVIAGLPLIWIALQELSLVNRALDQMGKLKIHAICVALFLVFGHIAMIAGMLDPSILGYKGTSAHQMSSGGGDSHEFCHPEEHEKMMKQHQQMMGNMPANQMPMNGGQMPGQMKQNMPMNTQGHNH
jgi:hypothetical protein